MATATKCTCHIRNTTQT